MSKEQLAIVSRFDSFSQADGSTTRKFGGSGLGLRISNSLANILGGSLEVRSEYQRGSTFVLSISAGDIEGVEMEEPHQIRCRLRRGLQSRHVTESSIPTTTDTTPLAGQHILLVEDGPDNQRLIAFHLEKAGAIVTIAEHGRVALDFIARQDPPFDVVFMDMQMPVMDGYETTRELRTAGFVQPIIALTAHAMDVERNKCLEAGCDDYATKPIDRKLLIEIAKRYVDIHELVITMKWLSRHLRFRFRSQIFRHVNPVIP